MSKSNFDVRINGAITNDKIRLVDMEGEFLGIMSGAAALKIGMEQGVDVVEVSPNVEPPVCKLMDYGKYKYEKKKQVTKAKKTQKVAVVKEVKISHSIAKHDLDIKTKHVQEFIADGNKVRISMRFRGREFYVMKERAIEVMKNLVSEVIESAKIDQDISYDQNGRSMFLVLSPK